MISILRTFSPYIRSFRKRLFTSVFCMLLLDLLMYLIPMATQYITDTVYPRIHEEGVLQKLYLIVAGLALLALVRGIAAHIMIRNYWGAAEGIVRNLRNALYEKFQHLDISHYDNARTGDLMSRATYDIQIIRNFFAYGIEHRLRIIIISLFVFSFMLMENWKTALGVYTAIPLFFLLILYFSSRMRKAVETRQRQMGILNTRLQENISGIRIVKSFAMESHEIDSFHRENNAMYSADRTMGLLQINLNAILLLTDGIGSLVIIVLGGYNVISGTMSLGQLLAFVGYLAVLGFPIRMLAFNTSVINQARGAGERIMEILNSPDQKRLNSGTTTAPIQGRLVFDNVSFSYTPKFQTLRNVSFTIEPGEHVALFGLTGAGKSTLISLIPRFYMPESGSITLDDIPLTGWEMNYLRSRIGTVLQETFLFSTSIYENILFGKPDATKEEVYDAARHAQIHDFISSLPEKYDTQIGEYGTGLSGGQKQRIAIARTLLQDPSILILDDCTSSLDAATERKIQQQLRELMKGRSTIIIAQRISTLALADRIIVLDRGSISSIDSHRNLLRNNELYRTMYQTQAGGAEIYSGRQPSEI